MDFPFFWESVPFSWSFSFQVIFCYFGHYECYFVKILDCTIFSNECFFCPIRTTYFFSWLGINYKLCFLGRSQLRFFFFVFSWFSLSFFYTHLIQESVVDLSKQFKDFLPDSYPLESPALFSIYDFLASLFWFFRLERPWVWVHVSLLPLCKTVWIEFSSKWTTLQT